MAYYRYRFSFGNESAPVIKKLLIVTGAVFVLQQLLDQAGSDRMMENLLGLVPYLVWHKFYLWQLVTYLFLHGDFSHILFNLLALWMFGGELEGAWGAKKFLKYYFLCGIGAGLCTTVFTVLLSSPLSQIVPVIGSSGAIYGLLLAYGWLFPNRPIMLYFIVPIPAKYFVIIFGFLELLYFSRGSGGGISHLTHLGGLLFGLVYMAYPVVRQKIRREYYRRKWSQRGPGSGNYYN
jgi:membrane associated rhomboid family serine protease